MMLKSMTSLAFAAACLTAIASMPAGAQMAGAYDSTSGAVVVTNGPRATQGDMSSSVSAHQNVIQSQRYDRSLETNRGFREARMRKECGPITDPQLRQQCLASFHQDEPYMGSSTSRRQARSDSG